MSFEVGQGQKIIDNTGNTDVIQKKSTIGESVSQAIAKVAKVALKAIVALGIALTLGLPLLSKSVRLFTADLFFGPDLERELEKAKINPKKAVEKAISSLEDAQEAARKEGKQALKPESLLAQKNALKKAPLSIEKLEQKREEIDEPLREIPLEKTRSQFLSKYAPEFEEARYDLESAQKIAKNMGSKPQHNLEEIAERAQMMKLATRTGKVQLKSPEKITRGDILDSIREAKAKKAEAETIYMEETTKKIVKHVGNNTGGYLFTLGTIALIGFAALKK